jgi:hypothetical protein
MMNRRRFLRAVGVSLVAAPRAAEAQPSKKTYRVGLLIGATEVFVAPYIEIFRQTLRALGYVEGRAIALEYRYADGHYDSLPALAADLVQLKVNIIVTEGTPPTRAAIRATKTIPIVMTVTGDPVAAGLVTNLARPGRKPHWRVLLSPRARREAPPATQGSHSCAQPYRRRLEPEQCRPRACRETDRDDGEGRGHRRAPHQDPGARRRR